MVNGHFCCLQSWELLSCFSNSNFNFNFWCAALRVTKYCIKQPPTRLKSRKPHVSYLRNIADMDATPPKVPSALQPYFSCFTNHPPGCEMPRRSWVQLKRLRSGFVRFNSFMHKIGLSNTELCVCGSPQTTYHVLHSCAILRPPCSIAQVNNDDLITHLNNAYFWPILVDNLRCVYEIIQSNESIITFILNQGH